jgi:hypothetical protein
MASSCWASTGLQLLPSAVLDFDHWGRVYARGEDYAVVADVARAAQRLEEAEGSRPTGGAAAAVVWLGSFFVPGWTHLRRLAAYVALSVIASAALVEALKYATNTDCPRDLLDFGGSNPHIAFFQWRPSTLPRAMCFPGAHAASGYSLLALFHAAASYRNRHDWRWLMPGLLLGTVFAFAQEARGAHFLSQAGEIGGEQRGGDSDTGRHGARV